MRGSSSADSEHGAGGPANGAETKPTRRVRDGSDAADLEWDWQGPGDDRMIRHKNVNSRVSQHQIDMGGQGAQRGTGPDLFSATSPLEGIAEVASSRSDVPMLMFF